MSSPTPLEQASATCRYYQQRLKEDATNEECIIGLETAHAWLDLVREEAPDHQRVENLLATLFGKNDFGGSAWFDLKLGVRGWARHLVAKGLIPMEFIKYVSRP